MKNKMLKILFICTIFSTVCYSNHSNFDIKRVNVDDFTNIKSIEIFIRSFNGPYSSRGSLEIQIDTLTKSAGIQIMIGSILQIMEYELKLKLNKFKPVKNYKKYIADFETYAVFKINTKKETIILAYDGDYLLNITHKKYRKVKGKSIFNFDPFS